MSSEAGGPRTAPIPNTPGWRLERLTDLESARGDWDRLAAGAGHPYATWEWIEPWCRWLLRGREPYAFACRDEAGDTVAILPMYVAASRPVRIARFLGYGSLNSPLCAPEHRGFAVEAVRAALGGGAGRCRLLYAEKLPPGQGWERLGGDPVDTHPDPVIHLRGRSWEEYLASRHAKVRQNVRRYERRARDGHELRFRLTEQPDALDADFDTFVRLHRMRWAEHPTGLFEGDHEAMHREIAAGFLARGWLRLWIAELDGAPAAAGYGFRYGGAEWGYQLGRDPELDHLGLGTVMTAHLIREACADGVEEFRLGEGAGPFKLRLADEVPLGESRVVGDGALEKAARMAISLVRSTPDSIRSRITPMGAKTRRAAQRSHQEPSS